MRNEINSKSRMVLQEGIAIKEFIHLRDTHNLILENPQFLRERKEIYIEIDNEINDCQICISKEVRLKLQPVKDWRF